MLDTVNKIISTLLLGGESYESSKGSIRCLYDC